ncbi:protein mono-ADP-ribosyltransferase PARP14-like [Mytilus californianus]|uniref:protein mono-ADP-ribosyltransferase PARP14-like n=1 Tax=Mytilus californianus TaxID=6549 RepID=UPI002247E8D9|nr:protein mono-ADP-ribosyltransferase PARP14-like [Mytilus californianus]
MQLRVTNIADSHRCCVSLLPDKVISTKLQTKPVDLREHIRCRSITVDDGFTVKLYKCSLQNNYWLGQNTLILNVGHSAGDDTSTIKCKVNLIQPGHATICLPIWKITKEKDYLQKLMTEMKDYVKSAKLQGLPPMSIDLSEVEKVRWPVVHFLGTILLSFIFSRPTYFQVFAPSDDIFEPSFNIINQWCQLEKGFLKQKLQINVVKGELAVMKCDVLVNATNREFDLSREMVSKALLKAAGVDLQHDCDMTIKGRKIQSTEVVVTGGYNLSAKKVFHGVLPRFKKENNIQQYESFIKNCLNTAVDLNMKSIAFPALGTGKLNYPSNTAASTMFLAVEAFASANNVGSLTEVNFVIFPADTSVLQVFEAEEHNRKKTASAGKMFDDSDVACPDFATCTVQVIGPTDKLIQETFKQIEEAFNRNGKTDQGIRSDRVAQLKASVKHGSKYPKGDIQYLQHLMNAMEDLRPDSLDRRQNMTYSSHNFPMAGTVWISEKMIKTSQLIQVRSPILYRPTEDSITKITNEGIKIFVYKADICYLSNVDCIVNPSSSKMKEIVGLTNIVLGAGEEMKKECSQYIEKHGVLREKCVCITTAGNLTHYKKILHVKAPARNEYLTIDAITENISAAIRICLSQANMDNMTSIALPPIITLGFNTVWNKDIVKTYPECVMKYSKEADMRRNIKEIHFVHTDQAEVEAIHSAFLQTIPDSYADEHIKRKDRASELLGHADMNEFHVLKTNTNTNTESLKFPISKNISHKTGKVKMYQSMPYLFPDGSENVPSNWTGMDANEMISTVVLKPHDQEYKDAVDEFKQRSTRHYDIIKVERIQNKTLHQQYIARKKLMDSINPFMHNNERKLWHGTTLDAVDGINTYGFNRGYCGKNAASYGNGVYFAVNPSYSTKTQYSTPDHNNNKRIYLCKVLVGEYVKGQRGIRVPPQKYGASRSHILYDSVVDNPSSPGMFVIFHDSQAYPEYLIVFR